MLRLEPWCMRPWEIARLTDHQIVNGYLFPQAKRQEELERRQKGGAPLPEGPEPELAEGAIPSRDFMVMSLMALGMSKADAEREYDAQLATATGQKR